MLVEHQHDRQQSPLVLHLQSIDRIYIIYLFIFYLEFFFPLLLDRHHKLSNTMMHINHSHIHYLLVIHRLHENVFELVYEQDNNNLQVSSNNHNNHCKNRYLSKFCYEFHQINKEYKNNHSNM